MAVAACVLTIILGVEWGLGVVGYSGRGGVRPDHHPGSGVGGNSFNTMFPNRHKAYWNYDTHGQLLNTVRISAGVMVVQATHGQLLKIARISAVVSGRVTECSRKRWEAG